MAGTLDLNDKIDKFSNNVWNLKNVADFYDAKDEKDLKYITMDWKVTDNNGLLGVQGDTSAGNRNYFT